MAFVGGRFEYILHLHLYMVGMHLSDIRRHLKHQSREFKGTDTLKSRHIVDGDWLYKQIISFPHHNFPLSPP